MVAAELAEEDSPPPPPPPPPPSRDERSIRVYLLAMLTTSTMTSRTAPPINANGNHAAAFAVPIAFALPATGDGARPEKPPAALPTPVARPPSPERMSEREFILPPFAGLLVSPPKSPFILVWF